MHSGVLFYKIIILLKYILTNLQFYYFVKNEVHYSYLDSLERSQGINAHK